MKSKQTPQELLWHYTSFEGLHGIVSQGKMFASSLAYLNDTEEFSYTVKALLELLEEKEREGVALSDLTRGLAFRDVPSVVKAVFRSVRGQTLFATCFSKERDDLSQWRSYTPNPPGFSIGFQTDRLDELAGSFNYAMAECSYPSSSELAGKVKETFQQATFGMNEEKRTLPMPASREATEAFADRWAFNVVAQIISLAPQYKHPKFAAEKEVRLFGRNPVSTDTGVARGSKNSFEVEYRRSGSLIVPYVRLPARLEEGPSPIKEILVGPCPHQQAVIEATQQMCLQHHIRAEVYASEVPYRNW